MNETKKRNTHLPEFKDKVGLEAVRGVKTVNQLAQEYGVHPVQVGQWTHEIIKKHIYAKKLQLHFMLYFEFTFANCEQPTPIR